MVFPQSWMSVTSRNKGGGGGICLRSRVYNAVNFRFPFACPGAARGLAKLVVFDFRLHENLPTCHSTILLETKQCSRSSKASRRKILSSRLASIKRSFLARHAHSSPACSPPSRGALLSRQPGQSTKRLLRFCSH